jgi:hypothetical protein
MWQRTFTVTFTIICLSGQLMMWPECYLPPLYHAYSMRYYIMSTSHIIPAYFEDTERRTSSVWRERTMMVPHVVLIRRSIFICVLCMLFESYTCSGGEQKHTVTSLHGDLYLACSDQTDATLAKGEETNGVGRFSQTRWRVAPGTYY